MSKFQIGDIVFSDELNNYMGKVVAMIPNEPDYCLVHTPGEPEYQKIGLSQLHASSEINGWGTPVLTPEEVDALIKDFDSLLTDAGCNHSWKQHIGLVDIFEYCIHCDVKKRAS